MYTIEIVASTVQSCIAAEKGGAKRVELCSALATAGVTPSAAFIEITKKSISIPVYVMIRPREGDFCYSAQEIDVMKREIDLAKSLGADGIVFGLLHANGTVNGQLTRELVEYCKPLPVTFHRAIDITPNLFDAAEAIIDAGCIRILTSGGKKMGPDGVQTLHALAEKTEGRIEIQPGGGITLESIDVLFHPLIRNYHMSARTAAVPSMQSDIFDMNWAETDEEIVRKVVAKAEAFFKQY